MRSSARPAARASSTAWNPVSRLAGAGRVGTELILECDYRMGRDGFTAPDGVHSLVRFGFQVDLLRGDGKRTRQRFPDFRKMWPQLRLLGYHYGVDMRNAQPGSVQQCSGMREEDQAGRALPLRIGVRKMLADIAESGRAQDCVAHRVAQHVTLGMAQRAPFAR